MFNRLIDDIKDSAGRAMRKTWFMAAIAISLFVTLAFLSAAAFVAVLERYGLIYACLSGAAIFFAVTLISLIAYAVSSRSSKALPPAERPEREEKSILETTLANPMMLAAGMQVVRAIGVKRLLPILAVAGVALGYFATRGMGTGENTSEENQSGD